MSHDLESVAVTLVADGKGILAADETVPTLTKRFDTLGIPSTDGMAGTRTWGPAGRPCTNGLAATAPPASGDTRNEVEAKPVAAGSPPHRRVWRDD